MTSTSYADLIQYMTPDEQSFLEGALSSDKMRWFPLPGPQSQAYESQADIIGYGGAAGGGKADLACGKALTQHEVVMILRRTAPELTGIIDRLTRILGSKDGYNGKDQIWRLKDGKQIEFGSVPHATDVTKYQGRPHDLLVFDEASNFLESQVRFLLGWLRSANPNQKCQALLTFNPPTTSDGRWILDYFGPWLKRNHPNPAKPGELRWFATVAGEDVEVDDDRAFVMVDGERNYDFEPTEVNVDDIIRPMSRTFIPSRVSDNPYLFGTGYMRTLQALPEPLRSQMLKGDFYAGIGEDPFQVIPSAWVDAAVARWRSKDRKPEMDSMGVDTARGGKDETVIMRRHDNWFDEPLAFAGSETPDGPKVAGLVVAHCRDGAVQHVEVNGVGASVYDFLREAKQDVKAIDVGAGTKETDKSGKLHFANIRTAMWWRMREALDPANNRGIALPDNPRLIADLTAPRWSLKGSRIAVESREEIVKRLGRSPDYGTACCLALMDSPKRKALQAITQQRRVQNDPYMNGGGVRSGKRAGYNPYENI